LLHDGWPKHLASHIFGTSPLGYRTQSCLEGPVARVRCFCLATRAGKKEKLHFMFSFVIYGDSTLFVEALNQLGTLYSGHALFPLDPLTYRTIVDWKTSPMEDSNDWIIDANGFYIAPARFSYGACFCCANQCRNLPYINWPTPRHGSPSCQQRQYV